VTAARRAIPAWAWIVALVPLSLFALAIAGELGTDRLRQYFRAPRAAEASPRSSEARAASAPTLAGEAIDLSSVMGRARKLADQWQREAALLGIEAVLHQGKIDTQAGASAKLTFGPSRFASHPPPSELFVVTYDRTGISGAPAAGPAGKALPEPMCAPEHVLLRAADLGEKPLRLRYAFDDDERALWFATPHDEPDRLRVFDPSDCSQRGTVVVRPRPRR
jgi:hypothetical protein